VIAIIAILASLLLPALGKAKVKAQGIACMANTKQLMLGWLLYAGDYGDKLMPAASWVGGSMDWTGAADNFNTDILLDPLKSLIAPYEKSVNVYKCPSDNFESAATPQPRVRSYAMNSILGGGGQTPNITTVQYPAGRHWPKNGAGAEKMADLRVPGPADVWVMLDEHPDSINDAQFHFDPGYQLTSGCYWRDMPGSTHNGACSLSFADGHSEIHRWMEVGRKDPVTGRLVATTVLPVIYQKFPAGVPGGDVGTGHYPCSYSVDWDWMNNGMPSNYQ
jgi:prepilin-type processing-associated H-X9-DG protein